MNRELSQRLARAMDMGAAMPDEREQVNAAAQVADTFADLPASVQALVHRWEAGADTHP